MKISHVVYKLFIIIYQKLDFLNLGGNIQNILKIVKLQKQLL